MKAIQLVKYGKADAAFQITEIPAPAAREGEVLIRVKTFGLNFADVMSRLHLYREAPSLPFVPGYEVVGTVEECPSGRFRKGDPVVAFTRFGGYAEMAITNERAVAVIPETMDRGEAAALATQYCTAYHAACDMANLREGETVLIHAAAGGVGIALTQLARLRGCMVAGTAGSDEKIAFLKEHGVDHAVNYRKEDFEKKIPELLGGQPDVIFDPVGGKNFKKGRKILNVGGRIVTYGASDQLNHKGPFAILNLILGFGFIHPIGLIMNNRGVLGVNMLKIADHKPEVLQHALQEVVRLTAEGKLKPVVGKEYPAEEIAEAHAFFESRRSIGKIVLHW